MSRTNVHFIVCLTLSCLTAAAVPASAQHFQQITGTPLSQIAAGRKEVWGLYNSRIYRFNPGSGGFDQIQGSLSQIAVGGGTLLQSDEVWGLDSGGSAYRFNFSTKTFTLQSGPGVLQLSQIAVGAGYEDNCHPYEIWGINSTYIYRYNYCISQFENIEISFIEKESISRGNPCCGAGRECHIREFLVAEGQQDEGRKMPVGREQQKQ